ncbi:MULTISPECIES: LysR family transcriptional regulator [Dyella]|uniref:LysR family transcriptional regulator n=2 Tax=Dyella TaxID=231454 RepID=A0A4V2NMD5_9GAMM|nr:MULTISPECIES: LysR family transcriptional regulator [Dyella]TBR39488.1 LysR family transcriptional regulator [Dyella terrae]TCI12927.1 LysR family transcriptional regulator [Dyella soli]
MDRFDALQLFVRIVEQGSFTRAAMSLDMPRATATLAIKELEARLGTRLLERTTRSVRPTLDGEAFYLRCQYLLSELDEAEASLRQSLDDPAGTLRVDVHGTHGSRIVMPRIGEFHARYPRITLKLSAGDRLVDPVREGVDCVIRAGEPRDSSLVARRLAVMPEVICASPDYLARMGQPATPADLGSHVAVGFFASDSDAGYPFELVVDGEVKTWRLAQWLTVNDAENYVSAARSGAGLIQLPRYHVEDELVRGELVEVLATWDSPGVPVSAMYPQHRQLAPRVRVFIDWVAAVYRERFGELP